MFLLKQMVHYLDFFNNCKYIKLNTTLDMKNIINKSLFNLIKSKSLILISSSLILTSCAVYTGGYSETDGVYYDPNKDSLPAGSYYGNQVDNYYNYQDTYPSLYENNQKNLQDQDNRYLQPLASDSDWGIYTGTETTYTNFNNWGWGMGYGWGYPYYGWYSPFNSWGWGLGFGWGWGSSFYSPWGGFYDPFWNYGWGSYYGGYHPGYHYNRSGANGSRLGGMMPQGRVGRSNGFQGINNVVRTPNNIVRNQNGTIRNQNSGVRNFPNNSVRNFPNGNVRNNDTPTYQNNNNGIRSNQNDGFRNNSFSTPRSGNTGGFNSGGGMRSGGGFGGGGGMRSGGGGGRR